MASEFVYAIWMVKLASAAIFAFVGSRVRNRLLGDEERRANAMFALWWFLVAALTVLGVALQMAALAGYRSLGLHVTGLHVTVLVLCVALWALTYYLFFVAWEKRFWFRSFGLLYAGLALLLFYVIAAAQPASVALRNDVPMVEYADGRTVLIADRLEQLLLVVLLAPPIVGAAGYLSVLARTRIRRVRYRVSLVSLSLLAWLMSSLGASLAGAAESATGTLVGALSGIVAALLVVAAYRPPRAIETWLQRQEGPVADAQD